MRDDKKSPVRARKESFHKACIFDFPTYEAAELETGKFVLSIIEYTWVHEFKRAKTYYTLVAAGEVIIHHQEMCGGIHDLGLLTLQNYM